LLTYFLSYLLVVYPAGSPEIFGSVDVGDEFKIPALYHMPDEIGEFIYAPALAIDRLLRPKVWTYTLTAEEFPTNWIQRSKNPTK